MANYTENFASKLDWAMPFQRTGKFPLDRTDLFSSYADAVKYAAGNTADPDSRELCGTSYVGQVIVVYENSTVSVYKIEEDRSLKEVGTATLGDNKSIELGDGNVLSLKNFGKKYYRYDESAEGHYVLVEDGTFPAGLQPKTTLAEDGTIELAWYEPSSTTVEGLSEQMSSLSQTVNTLQQTVSTNTTNISNKVDKEEGKGLSSNDYTDAEKSKLSGIEAGAQKNVKSDWNAEADTASEILNKPTKLSEFSNDEGFIDNTVSNLVNYYTKTNTYSKDEVNTLIGNLAIISIQVVSSLPETGASNIIYLIAKATADGEQNTYDEYLWTGSKFEKIGDTTIDLSNYLQKTGDATNTTVSFTTPSSRALPITGETLGVIVGKVLKYLSDLKDVAFTGSYDDLTGKPTQVVNYTKGTLTAGDTSITINFTGSYLGSHCYDVTTGEDVMVDVITTTGSATISIAQAHTNNISITLMHT